VHARHSDTGHALPPRPGTAWHCRCRSAGSPFGSCCAAA